MAREKLEKKERMKIPRQEMPAQAPMERIKNFNEVALGFTEELALAEADRCLECKKPKCVDGCPVGIDIPGFVAKIQEGDFETALAIIKKDNTLPAICGRVCPQEDQCEVVCVTGKKAEPVAIGRLERFVADWEMAQGEIKMPTQKPATGFKVAVVGSGPAGLACAADLALRGHKVTIFEALHKPGGVLVYGIPEFRLPKRIVQEEIGNLEKLGVEIRCNFIIGKTASVEDLFDEYGYDAIFLGTGAGLPYFMGIPGENYIGVLSANEFLTRVNLMKAFSFPDYDTPVRLGNNVAVVGSGNVAMDCLRTAKRLGAENVICLYRRTRDESPARLEELEHAEEEGIDFRWLSSPVEIYGNEDGLVTGARVQRMELGEPDDSGRRRPVPIEGDQYDIELDQLVMGIGQGPNPVVTKSTKGLELNRWGNIVVDEETMMTSIAGVFAGGDIVTGAATVILAMGAGKKASAGIDAYLKDTANATKSA
jgi:glutamate synthase (NADPH/NADH) small chain